MVNGKPPEKQQVRITAIPEVKPFYANEVFVNVTWKETKDKKEREVMFSLDFIDTRTKLIVASVNITQLLAKGLIDALNKAIKQANEFLKTGKKPKEITKTATDEEQTYIG